jgi:cobalt/nickel transport system ATP-binding protein
MSLKPENILEAKNCIITYPDGTNALRAVDLGIRKGRTTAILGGNGSGKTTLLLNLNGILKPSAGEIKKDGQAIAYSRKSLNELRRSVGLVFQDPDSQLFSASVYQDISFGPLNLGLAEEEVRRRVESSLLRTGIADLKSKPTHCLSFGQKKRVAIAGVLAMQPEVLILDEPTAGLDPRSIGEVMRLLRKMQQDLGITVVLATHDIDIVPLFCDYVYVLDNGEIVLEGSPDLVFAQADTLRKVHLRLPRIAHLMEILHKEDGFHYEESAATISQARRVIKKWRTETLRMKDNEV